MSSLDSVRDYFNREARRFDAIYEQKKPWHQRVVDRACRTVVIERFKLICNLAPIRGEWTVLDVGCGSGRYAIALAQGGAARVMGIDVAASMVDLARSESDRLGYRNRCEFQTSGFLDFATDERFDVVVATGYYDYLEDPLPHLQKMLKLSRGRVFATFPKRWEYRVPLRKTRFLLERGYVRFYSRREIVALARACGLPLDRLSLVDLGRDYVAIMRP
jgi:2-polyprenyl-3-methyl-5-hydroxy-6-metoxy-1,4-benzoquinol methylase